MRSDVKDVDGPLGDLICEVLTSCYAAENRQALQKAAKQRHINLEQLVAAALTSAILEAFEVRPRAKA